MSSYRGTLGLHVPLQQIMILRAKRFFVSLCGKKEQTLHRSYLIYTVNISSTLVINTTIGSIINTTRQHCQRCMPVWFAFSEKSIKMTLSPILSFHSKCKINFVLR